MLSDGPDPDEGPISLWASPLAALGRWKIFQFGITSKAIHTSMVLGAVPQTAAPFANFQLHAQIHLHFSVIACNPGNFVFVLLSVGMTGSPDCAWEFYCPHGCVQSVLRVDSSYSSPRRVWNLTRKRSTNRIGKNSTTSRLRIRGANVLFSTLVTRRLRRVLLSCVQVN